MPDAPSASAGNVFKGKIAGLPTPVVILVVAGGIFYAYWRNKQGSGSSTADSGSGSSDQSGQNGAGTVVTGTSPITTPNTSTTPTYTDNLDWTNHALQWIAANPNVANPIVAGTAIGVYLNGGALTQAQANIINAIITAIGPPPVPPEGNVIITPTPAPVAPPPVPVTPKPPPKTTPPPKPVQRTYTVKHGDTLWSIAQHFYGSGSQWPKIYNANKNKIKNPNLIYAGQVLVIP